MGRNCNRNCGDEQRKIPDCLGISVYALIDIGKLALAFDRARLLPSTEYVGYKTYAGRSETYTVCETYTACDKLVSRIIWVEYFRPSYVVLKRPLYSSVGEEL